MGRALALPVHALSCISLLILFAQSFGLNVGAIIDRPAMECYEFALRAGKYEKPYRTGDH